MAATQKAWWRGHAFAAAWSAETAVAVTAACWPHAALAAVLAAVRFHMRAPLLQVQLQQQVPQPRPCGVG